MNWRTLRRLTAFVVLVALGVCGSPAATDDGLRTGEPVVWPAPTEPGFTPPTYDRTQDRGIWGAPAAADPFYPDSTGEKEQPPTIAVTTVVRAGCIVSVAVHGFSASGGDIVFTINAVVQHVVPGSAESFETSFEIAKPPGTHRLTATQGAYSAYADFTVFEPDWFVVPDTATELPMPNPWVTPGEVYDDHPASDGWRVGTVYHGRERIDVYCRDIGNGIGECEMFWWVWYNGRWVLLRAWSDYTTAPDGRDPVDFVSAHGWSIRADQPVVCG